MPSAEDRIQGAIVDYVRLVAPHLRIIAVPNASRRTTGGKATNGVPGLTPGAHDLIVILPAGRVLWWEVKQPGKGLDPHQVLFHADIAALDHSTAVVRSIEDARAELARAGIATREVASDQTRSPPCFRPTTSHRSRFTPGSGPCSPALRAEPMPPRCAGRRPPRSSPRPLKPSP